MLRTAQDKFGDDIVQDGNEEDKHGNIAALDGESVFRRVGQIEENGLKKEMCM